MEKGKRIGAELQLAEAIIEHIQYFLNGNEAVQTTLLSYVDFHKRAFEHKSDFEFWKMVNMMDSSCGICFATSSVRIGKPYDIKIGVGADERLANKV